MQLKPENLTHIHHDAIQLPGPAIFDLPEKVLQFGTGVLLRGLPDYYIDKANKQGLFNGRIVMVKSTPGELSRAYETQSGLYTHCLRGIEEGREVGENVVNASVSRVLSATKDWDQVLAFATDPQLQLIISNTTETGITLSDDKIYAQPPQTFPGKLLAVLYRRYQYFKGDLSKGVVVIPTELIPDNGTALRSIILELSDQNQLGDDFKQWLQASTTFCNSLVDRIVPGKLPSAASNEMEQRLGYSDELMMMSETYGLWAIESTGEKVKEILSFHQCDEGVVISPDISKYRELKLRLLNGSHTFTCGLAFLSGFKTVKEAMANRIFESFIMALMMQEIVPSITGEDLDTSQATSFANRVLDRYRNPFMEHQWLSITLQYSSKMNMRNAALIKQYIEHYDAVPAYMSLGLAAWIRFMKCKKGYDGKYYGEVNGQSYIVNDDHAGIFESLWEQYPVDELAEKVLCNPVIWTIDLGDLKTLSAEVSRNLQALSVEGPVNVMQAMVAHAQMDNKPA